MKLLINTASTYKGGGVQVAKSFLEECKNFPDNEYHVLLGQSLESVTDVRSYPGNFRFYPIGDRPGRNLFKAWLGNGFDSFEKEIKPDVVFTTSGPAYWRPKAPHLVGFNLGHHVYPESPFFKMISLKPRIRWALKRKLHSYFFKRDSDAFVVQTDDVRERVKNLLKTQNVYTVSNVHSSDYASTRSFPSKLPAKKEIEFRLLSLSAYHQHKNLEVIRKVIPLLKAEGYSNVRFILTIDSENFTRYFAGIDSSQLINVGPVSISEAPSLYKEVDAMFLPTLIECFSASYPEAMSMEKPILTSDLGFAHTVCGDAAVYFDPLNETEIADKIISLYQNKTLQQNLKQKGLERLPAFPSARERAEKYLELCKQLSTQKI